MNQTVVSLSYLSNVEPSRQGEVSSLLNLCRILGGVRHLYQQMIRHGLMARPLRSSQFLSFRSSGP